MKQAIKTAEKQLSKNLTDTLYQLDTAAVNFALPQRSSAAKLSTHIRSQVSSKLLKSSGRGLPMPPGASEPCVIPAPMAQFLDHAPSATRNELCPFHPSDGCNCRALQAQINHLWIDVRNFNRAEQPSSAIPLLEEIERLHAAKTKKAGAA